MSVSALTKTISQLRQGFRTLSAQFKRDGLLLEDPKVTADGHSVANIYMLDENNNKTDNVCIAISYLLTDDGFEDVSFLKAGLSGQKSKPIKGPLTQDDLQEAVHKQLKEWYPEIKNARHLSNTFDEIYNK